MFHVSYTNLDSQEIISLERHIQGFPKKCNFDFGSKVSQNSIFWKRNPVFENV